MKMTNKTSNLHSQKHRPMPAFLQEFADAYPRLLPLTERVNQFWHKLTKMLGIVTVSPAKAPPVYHPTRVQTTKSEVASKGIPELMAAASLSRAIHMQDELASEAKKLIACYRQSDLQNIITKEQLRQDFAAFEGKYQGINLSDLDIETLELYEQVMELSIAIADSD